MDALIGKLVDDYGWALLVLTLSTAGFVCAGLVLILLVGRASMEHQRQWRAAGEARDLLQETIDSLSAGVVVYDQNERLVMFNAAAMASTPVLKRPGIIGISYEELARETAKLSQEFGAPLENTAEEWIARFRSKGRRIMRQAVGERWFEWSEKLTPSGRTVGLGSTSPISRRTRWRSSMRATCFRKPSMRCRQASCSTTRMSGW